MFSLGLIPARYASLRFPGKPLALLEGKTVIQHVYERVVDHLDDVYVCTDDDCIFQTVKNFGGKAIMTAADWNCGTERCCAAYQSLGIPADVVVNVQGDEPFVHPSQLDVLLRSFEENDTQIATLAKPYTIQNSLADLRNPNCTKVVLDVHQQAISFSRSVIPYIRDIEPCSWLTTHRFLRHVGIYAYRPAVLTQFISLGQGILERMESLEQLRWIENGYKIKVCETDVETIGIDTPEDLIRAEQYLKSLKGVY